MSDEPIEAPQTVQAVLIAHNEALSGLLTLVEQLNKKLALLEARLDEPRIVVPEFTGRIQ